MKKTVRVSLCLAMLVLVCTTACGVGSAADKTRLTFWNMPFVTQEVSPDYVKWWEDAVVRALPDVVVDKFYGPGSYPEMQKKYVIQAKTGKPDVIEGLVEDMPIYISMGLIAGLTDKFNAWAEKDNFVKGPVSALTIDGTVYGIPYNTNARVLLYRKDLFKEYGLEVPKTWDELVKTASAITRKSNKKVYGFTCVTEVGESRGFQEFISWYFQLSKGRQIFEKVGGKWACVATPEQFEKVLQLYYDLLFSDPEYPAMDPAQRGGGWMPEDNGYVAGKWAMVPMGPWIWGHRADNETARAILEEKTGIAPLPVAPGGIQATYMEVKPIMINAHSKDQDKAWELVKFITSRDAMAGWAASSGFIPARKDVSALDEFKTNWWQQGFGAQLPTGVCPSPLNWAPAKDAIFKAMNAVIYKTLTPKEAAKRLCEDLTRVANEGLL